MLPTGTFGLGGDPIVASALDGKFYFASLARFANNGERRIGVATSVDGGLSFGGWLNANPLLSGVIADKPEMAVDRTATSPYVGNVYVCYWDSGTIGDIHVYRDASGNQGQTWGTDERLTTAPSPLPVTCFQDTPIHSTNFDCALKSPCYFGDYVGIASLNPMSSGFVYAWGDTRETRVKLISEPVDCAGGSSSPDPNVYTAVGC